MWKEGIARGGMGGIMRQGCRGSVIGMVAGGVEGQWGRWIERSVGEALAVHTGKGDMTGFGGGG